MVRASRALIASLAILASTACGAGETAPDDTADDAAETIAGDVQTLEIDSAAPDIADDSAAVDSADSVDAGDDAAAAPEPGAMGAACTGNGDCLSGWCVSSNLGPVCTRTCVEECPSGWSCLGIAGETDVTFLCVPRGDRLCGACTVDSQCGSGLCLQTDEGQRCTAACDDEGECPSGFVCELATSATTPGEESLQCVPAHGSCDCMAGDEGRQRPCNVDNAFGTCWGTQTCQGQSGWSACDAHVPTAEVCDGVDNNCNLFTDENLVDDTPCEKSNAFGTCPGRRVCEHEAGFVCVAPEAAPETCNFADDDCDGLVDEDYADPISGLYVSDQNCGVCGNDCTGFFPHALSGCAVDEANGAARCVVVSCAPGYYQAGPTTCLPVVHTQCLPCTEDANCVVPGNACVELDGHRACAEDCGPGALAGQGSCADGFTCRPLPGAAGRKVCLPDTGSCECLAEDRGLTRACTRANSFGTCAGSETCGDDGFSACTAREPAAETCNGQDDDCDGVADEDVVAPTAPCKKTNGNGTCEGRWTCAGAGGWVCDAKTPAAETCNGQDDDCDGASDEDFKDGALYLDEDHCGLCGRSCDSVVLFAEATACVAKDGVAVCVASRCDPGFYIPPDTDRVCVPSSGAKPCSPCADDAQCSELRGGQCTELDGARFCTTSCATAADCGQGYQCTAGRCLPKSASCTCLAGDAGEVRPCVASNDAGTCTGVETCNPTTGWSACSAPEPAAEACNGQDDDCDGRVDEDVVHDPTTCTVSNGNGTCSAVWRCDPTQGWVCPVDTPKAETCNFADDNCDGKIDDGFRNAQGRYVGDANCGNCGTSCGGLVPNATAHCVDDGTRARCEVSACAPGFYKAGPLTCLPAIDAACVPCTSDASCPTPGDKCLDLDGGKYCGRDCSATNQHNLPAGQCDPGYTCTAIGGGQQCVPSSGSCSCMPGDEDEVRTCHVANAVGTCFGTERCDPAGGGWGECGAATPAAETCNGQDDDCDGRVDEDLAPPTEACAHENLHGTCSAAWTCEGANGWACHAREPAAEACNGQDDDCDGTTDETFLSDGVYLGYFDCGACGVSCDGVIPNALEVCRKFGQSARCEVAECAPGYYQANATTCLPAVDNTCQPCVNDLNCPTPGDRCLDLDGQSGGRFCGRDCSATNKHGYPAGECDDGFACLTIGDAAQCVPLSGSCSCLDEDRESVRSCKAEATLGGVVATCLGTEVCVPEDGWGGCTAKTPAAEVCNGLDDDCDGRVDEDVAPPTEPCAVTVGADTCTAAWVCGGAVGWQCHAATPATETCNGRDDDCDGQVDEPFKNGSGVYATADACGACGLSCLGAIPNATASCVAAGTSARCEVAACDPGFYQAGALACLPATDATCVPCVSDANCPTPGDRCLDLDGGRFCGRDCAAGNKHGFLAGACGEGFTCVAFPVLGAEQCVPDSGSCTCLADDDGDRRTCVSQNAFGTCFGNETCDAHAAGWAGCSAKIAAAELCNGQDDDCDGLVDEDVVEPAEACAHTVGDATCSAPWVCAGAGGWKCNAATPEPEACDFVDNDCDGAVDEGYKSGAVYLDDDHCGSCGISCAGAIPYATARCGLGPSGAPRCEVAACDEGYFPSSDLSCSPVADNLCGACVNDTDCRTPGDRCVTLGGAKLCGRDCSADNLHGTAAGACDPGYVCTAFAGGPDQCVPTSGTCSCLPDNHGANRTCQKANAAGTCFGTETCDADAGWIGCSAKTPDAETCNGLDDDCDGLVDESLVHSPATCANSNADGTCTAAWSCQGAGGWQCNPATPAAETCNFADDDCDGAVDETFRSDGRYLDDEHCGSCGISCVGAIPNATATCRLSGTTPRCEVLSCTPGYYQAGPLTCLLAGDNTCAPCITDANCKNPGDKCITLDGAKVCGRDCAAGNVHGTTACASGQYCKDLGGDVHQCVPVSESCSCVAGDAGDTRACSSANAAGTCLGAQTCDPAAGWSACDARIPAAETCNAADDDCNFVTDDVTGRGAACTISNAAGTCPGVRDCAEGSAALTCVGRIPAAESCNYVDDDCNGDTDETFASLGQSCFDGEGACRRFGIEVCTADGLATQCNAHKGLPANESCDGIDNDCDTETDEDYDNKGDVCSLGVGQCTSYGNFVCNAEGTDTVCNAPTVTGNAESCDLLDNDCDNQTDEDFKTDGKYATTTACGNCFTNCTAIFAGRTQAYGVCDSAPATPVCTMACNAGYYDLNNVPGDGCELALDGAAIYVGTDSPGAIDDATCGLGPAGTTAGYHPCKTIAYGRTRATATGRTKVLVADGQYNEQVTVASGQSLYGGYRADTWERHVASTGTIIRGPDGSGDRKAVVITDVTATTRFDGFVVYAANAISTGANSYGIYVRNPTAVLTITNNLVFAGLGGPGSTGIAGASGDNGVAGTAGLPTKHLSACTSTPNNGGGAGGAKTCTNPDGSGTTSVQGGKGGDSICPGRNTQEGSGANGANSGGSGGAGGWGHNSTGSGCTPSSAGPETGFNGNDGLVGASTDGAGGAACSDGTGTVVGNEWRGYAGSAGSHGLHGAGGGGGGAGSGGYLSSSSWDISGSGGGGGSGGCAGSRGGGGQPGGASIGIFVMWQSGSKPTSAAGVPSITGNVLARNQGGPGGAGGNGGAGGDPGAGALGGALTSDHTSPVFCVFGGAKGGFGSRGGHGGGGGGACGGASYDIYVFGINGQSHGFAGNTFAQGATATGGGGGAGGNSSNTAKAGAAGAGGDAGMIKVVD